MNLIVVRFWSESLQRRCTLYLLTTYIPPPTHRCSQQKACFWIVWLDLVKKTVYNFNCAVQSVIYNKNKIKSTQRISLSPCCFVETLNNRLLSPLTWLCMLPLWLRYNLWNKPHSCGVSTWNITLISRCVVWWSYCQCECVAAFQPHTSVGKEVNNCLCQCT